MKNYIYYFLLLNITIISNLFGQNIIIRGADNGDLPDNFLSTGNYYYKDVHNYLDNFTGTWEYTDGNEKFEIILTKITFHHTIHSDLNLNYFNDGIALIYKKYENNNLIFESPTYQYPMFTTEDGIILKGMIEDFGRITKTVYTPLTNEVFKQGGYPIAPICWITKQPNEVGEPPKVFFDLYLRDSMDYDNETYANQPTFSIPNRVILTKVN